MMILIQLTLSYVLIYVFPRNTTSLFRRLQRRRFCVSILVLMITIVRTLVIQAVIHTSFVRGHGINPSKRLANAEDTLSQRRCPRIHSSQFSYKRYLEQPNVPEEQYNRGKEPQPHFPWYSCLFGHPEHPIHCPS